MYYCIKQPIIDVGLLFEIQILIVSPIPIPQITINIIKNQLQIFAQKLNFELASLRCFKLHVAYSTTHSTLFLKGELMISIFNKS